jgi:hypothetical protein
MTISRASFTVVTVVVVTLAARSAARAEPTPADVEQQVLLARRASAAGQHAAAVEHARAVLRSRVDLQALHVLSASACALKKVELALWALRALPQTERAAARARCRQLGIDVDRASRPGLLGSRELACRADSDCQPLANDPCACAPCGGQRVVNQATALAASRQRASCRRAACPACDPPPVACVGGRCRVARPRDAGVCHPPSGLVACPSTVRGALDREIIQQLVHARMEQLARCLAPRGAQRGRVNLRFIITAAGRVVAASRGTGDAVERCLLAAIRSWRFPSASGGVVIVDLPLLLTAPLP